MKKYSNSNFWGLLLAFPFIFFYVLFLLYPTIYTLLFSFTDSPLIGWGKWVGLENYFKLFNDKLFLKSLKNTFVFVFWTVVPNTLIGLMCAMMINRLKNPYIAAFLLACFFIPHILPVTVVTQVWSWMLSKQYGIIQEFLEFLGYAKIAFFKKKQFAMPAVAIVTIWWTVGFNILLFIAGLKSINPEIYEASDLDGVAGPIFPGAGSEGILVIILVIIWIGWTVISSRQESDKLEKLARKRPSSNAWKSNITDG